MTSDLSAWLSAGDQTDGSKWNFAMQTVCRSLSHFFLINSCHSLHPQCCILAWQHLLTGCIFDTLKCVPQNFITRELVISAQTFVGPSCILWDLSDLEQTQGPLIDWIVSSNICERQSNTCWLPISTGYPWSTPYDAVDMAALIFTVYISLLICERLLCNQSSDSGFQLTATWTQPHKDVTWRAITLHRLQSLPLGLLTHKLP